MPLVDMEVDFQLSGPRAVCKTANSQFQIAFDGFWRHKVFVRDGSDMLIALVYGLGVSAFFAWQLGLRFALGNLGFSLFGMFIGWFLLFFPYRARQVAAGAALLIRAKECRQAPP